MLRAVKLLNFGLPGSMNLLTFSLPKTRMKGRKLVSSVDEAICSLCGLAARSAASLYNKEDRVHASHESRQ
jgi:hypothetical protein